MKLIVGIFGVVLVILALFTWSDYYYSKLSREYPLLMDTLYIEGVITDYKVHWKYSYVTIDSKRKILVRPTENEADSMKYFHELIEVGDSIYKGGDSDKILLMKNWQVYKFKNVETYQ